MEERERGALMVEVGGSCVERKSWNFGNLEFWKMEKLVVVKEGREIRKKEKGKEIIMRRYFLGREDENNGSGGFPGFSLSLIHI